MSSFHIHALLSYRTPMQRLTVTAGLWLLWQAVSSTIRPVKEVMLCLTKGHGTRVDCIKELCLISLSALTRQTKLPSLSSISQISCYVSSCCPLVLKSDHRFVFPEYRSDTFLAVAIATVGPSALLTWVSPPAF